MLEAEEAEVHLRWSRRARMTQGLVPVQARLGSRVRPRQARGSQDQSWEPGRLPGCGEEDESKQSPSSVS